MNIPQDMAQFYSPSGEYYEKNVLHTLKNLVTKDTCFYDVGANYGYYSYQLAPFVAQVYAFEPVKNTFEVLLDNTKTFLNVMCFNYGLYKEEGEKEINLYSVSGCNSITRRNADMLTHIGTEIIKVNALDVMTSMTLTHSPLFIPPTLIKIDVEGVEKFVLEGGINTIKKYMPAMVIEYSANCARDAGYAVYEIVELLVSLGYSVYALLGDEDCNLHREVNFYDPNITNIVAVRR